MNSPASFGRAPVGVSRSSEVLNLSDSVRTVALVCGPTPTGLDVLPFDADMVIIRKTQDATDELARETDAYLVIPSGLDLMQALLREGLIEKTARILWAFGLPVAESMLELEVQQLPEGLMVTGFSGQPHRAILVTTVREESSHDGESFRMGLETARLATGRTQVYRDIDSQTIEQRLLQELRAKHISLLASLGSEAVNREPTAVSVPRTDVAELKNDLTTLRRNYAILERKYNALAQSKLGRLTLRLWRRKSYTTRSNE